MVYMWRNAALIRTPGQAGAQHAVPLQGYKGRMRV